MSRYKLLMKKALNPCNVITERTKANRDLFTDLIDSRPVTAQISQLGFKRYIVPEGATLEKITQSLYLLPLEAMSGGDKFDVSVYIKGSREMLSGLFWAIKLEWGGRISFNFPYDLVIPGLENKRAFKADAHIYGRWVQALLHLCEKASTALEASGGGQLSTMKMFKVTLEDISRNGGVAESLIPVYPWPESDEAYNKKKYVADLSKVCTRLKRLERPKDGPVFNELVQLSMELDDKRDSPEKGVLHIFCDITRELILEILTPKYSTNILAIDENGGFHHQACIGKGGEMSVIDKPK